MIGRSSTVRWSSAALCLAAVLLTSGVTEAVKHRRPFAENIGLGYGFDNDGSGSNGACKNYQCGGGTCYDSHSGSDYPLPFGTNVLAGAPGVVVTKVQGCANVGYLGNPCGSYCGNYVKLQHSDGTYSLYCHLKNGSISVNNGQTVSCGQKLGESASSGSSTGYHLHFAWQQGSKKDPYSGSCASGGGWVSQGSFGGSPGTGCEVACQCSPGQVQSKGCGNCGSQSRTCKSNCTWGGWSGCQGQGACAPGASQSDGCGNCGTRTRSCQSNCAWSGWSSCQGQGACAPGANQSEGCGNCGIRARSCQSNCSWGGWSSCDGQGVCAPGALESEDCCDCGTRTRQCSSGCDWPGWSACEGPDPVDAACDTGALGPCATGALLCLEGCTACTEVVVPSAELCDGTDNDCDGTIDEDATQMGATAPPFAARIVDMSAPLALYEGEIGAGWVRIRNEGTEPWAPWVTWLSAAATDEGVSPLWAPSAWPAYDAAAQLEVEVPPGEIAVFSISLRGPSADVQPVPTTFQLVAAGEVIACPAAAVELTVESMGPGAADEPAGDWHLSWGDPMTGRAAPEPSAPSPATVGGAESPGEPEPADFGASPTRPEGLTSRPVAAPEAGEVSEPSAGAPISPVLSRDGCSSSSRTDRTVTASPWWFAWMLVLVGLRRFHRRRRFHDPASRI